MNSIDLITFAEHSQRLPKKLLAPIGEKKSQTLRILAAHLIDFWLGLGLTTMMGVISSHSFESLMVTSSLKDAYSAENLTSFSFFFLPFVLVNYFFFSYFMNHGQTWGMYLMKRRIVMEDKSFREAFLWAAHSVLLCLSGGFYYAFRKDIWKSYQAYDYLYSELLTHKEDMRIDLLTRIDDQKEEVEETQWQRAA